MNAVKVVMLVFTAPSRCSLVTSNLWGDFNARSSTRDVALHSIKMRNTWVVYERTL